MDETEGCEYSPSDDTQGTEIFNNATEADIDLEWQPIDVGTQVSLDGELQFLELAVNDQDSNNINKMGKKKFPILRNKKGHPIFSREDMREQYCITKKELDSLEEQRSAPGLFRCVQNPPKIKSRGSGLFSCVQKNSSRNEEDVDSLKGTFIKSATWSPKSNTTFFAQGENKDPTSDHEYFKPRPRPRSYCAADMARRRQVFGGLTERTSSGSKPRPKITNSHNSSPSIILGKQNPDVIPHSHSCTPISRHTSKEEQILSSPTRREILGSTENHFSPSDSPIPPPRSQSSNFRKLEDTTELSELQKQDRHVSFNSISPENSPNAVSVETTFNLGPLSHIKRGFSSEERLLNYGVNKDFNPSDRSATLPPLQRRKRRPSRSSKSQATQTDYMGMCFVPDYLWQEENHSNLKMAWSSGNFSGLKGNIEDVWRTKTDCLASRNIVPTAAELKSAAQATIAQIENLSHGSNHSSTPLVNERKIVTTPDRLVSLAEKFQGKGGSSSPSPPPHLNGHVTRESSSLPGSPSRVFTRQVGKDSPVLGSKRSPNHESPYSGSPGSPFLRRMAMFQENLQKEMSANMESERQSCENSSTKSFFQDNLTRHQGSGNVAGQHEELQSAVDYHKLQNVENAFFAAQTSLLQQLLKTETHHQSITSLSSTPIRHINQSLKISSSAPTSPNKKQENELMLKLLWQRKALQESESPTSPSSKIESMVADWKNGNLKNDPLPSDGEGNLLSHSPDGLKISHVRDANILNCQSHFDFELELEKTMDGKWPNSIKRSVNDDIFRDNYAKNETQNSESQTAITVGTSKINSRSSHLRVLSAEMENIDQKLYDNQADIKNIHDQESEHFFSPFIRPVNGEIDQRMASFISSALQPTTTLPPLSPGKQRNVNNYIPSSTSSPSSNSIRRESLPPPPSPLENQHEFLNCQLTPLPPPPPPPPPPIELTLDDVLNELSSVQEMKGARSPAAFPLVVDEELLKDMADKSDASSMLESTRSDLSSSKKDRSQSIETFENVDPSEMPDLPKDSPSFVKRIKDELSSQDTDSMKSSSAESSPYRSFHSPSRFESSQTPPERKRISYHGDSSMYQQMAPVIAELAARERQRSAEDLTLSSNRDLGLIATIGRRDSCGSNTSSRCEKPENAEVQRLRSHRRSADSYRSSSDDLSDDEDIGVYMDSYRNSAWFYVGDTEELAITAMGALSEEEDTSDESCRSSPVSCLSRAESLESTASEREFRKRYQAVTRRMVHRKSIIEMYKRLSTKTFDSDKVIILERKNGEFGFRIHGSRPVVASAVDKGGSADLAGLMVGDIIITLNGINVLDMTHTDVVQLAQQSSEIIQLEIARIPPTTKHPLMEDDPQKPIISGYLYKLAGSSLLKRWHRRWFVLKKDNFLYYYKSGKEKEPLGAIMLQNFTVSKAPDVGRSHAFKISKFGSAVHHFAAESEEDMNRWAGWMNHAVTSAQNMDTWLEISTRNIQLPALSIHNPDCHGYLIKLGEKRKTWRRRYCVLKDACIYFFIDMNATSALGIAHLHGYSIQDNSTSGKKYTFDLMPPEKKLRRFTFQADNHTDMKRWTAAMEYSIGRWIKVD